MTMQTTQGSMGVSPGPLFGTKEDLYNKLVSSPYAYVHVKECCFNLCPCYQIKCDVYASNQKIEGNDFNDLIFRVDREICCTYCQRCAKIRVYPPNSDNQLLFYTYPNCCLCVKTCCNCSCYSYGDPLLGYFGDDMNNTFGNFRRKFCGCIRFLEICNPDRYEFYGRTGETRFELVLDCLTYCNPAKSCYPIVYNIIKDSNAIGKVTFRPLCCCKPIIAEIEFPPNFNLDDRLLLVGFCCSANRSY